MPQPDHNTALEGTLVGDTYRVGRRIGEGAMGAVFEATHLRLAGRYAIKVLQADIASHPEVLARFQREASITSQLRHPNIISVLDFNLTPDGRPFLAMELLEGTELTHEIRRSAPMPLHRVLDLVTQVASALTAAHAHGIVHRDLKPQNLFLVRMSGEDRELIKVLDFGISKVHEATTLLTQANVVIGTPQYMSPEQAQGQVAGIDHRVDQFALGAIAYELLTGRPAFRGDSIPSVLYQVVHEHPEPIRELNRSVPAHVEAAIMRALAKKADDRFAQVRDFQAALTHAPGTPEKAPFSSPGGDEGPGGATRRDPVLAARTTAVQPAETTFTTATAELGNDTLAMLRPRRLPALIALGVGAAAVITGGWYFGGSQRETASAVPRPNLTEPGAAPAPVVRAAVEVPVEILDPPPGLTVTVDQRPASLPLSLPRGSRSYTLGFAAAGFDPREIVVDGNQASQQLRLDMRPSPVASPPAPIPAVAGPTDQLPMPAAAPARSRARPRSNDARATEAPPPPVASPGREPTRLIRDLDPAEPAPATPAVPAKPAPRSRIITDF